MYLNTDSRAVVRYDDQLRRVDLQRGEAMFEVARRPDWPFVVTAGDREIRALGTAFLVRRDPETLAVTLVEGKVSVAPAHDGVEGNQQEQGRDVGEAELQTHAPAASSDSARAAFDRVTLSPGQRLTFVSSAPPRLDRPAIGNLTAWQRGQVALDEVDLADAVSEMNRYSRIRLVLQDPAAVSAIRVSGVFRAGDSENFAEAVARTYGLQLRTRGRQIVIGAPAASDLTGMVDR
jgi:transmembrane sensor